MDRSSRHPIARTALASNRTPLTVRPLGSIPVAHLHVPLFFPLITQYLSLRTPITVARRIIDKLRAVIRRTHSAPFIGTLALARLIHTGPDELDTPLLHRHYIVPADKPTIAHHLFGSLAQILFHSLDSRLQLFKVIARLHHSHGHHHPVSCIRVDLHVVARRKPAASLLHYPGLRITRAHPSVFFVLTPAFFGQLVKLLQRLLQPLLPLTGRSLARLGHAPARFLFAQRSHRRHLLLGLLERLLHSLFPAKTIRRRVGSDLGPVLHHSLQCYQPIGTQNPQTLHEQFLEHRFVLDPKVRQRVRINHPRPGQPLIPRLPLTQLFDRSR